MLHHELASYRLADIEAHLASISAPPSRARAGPHVASYALLVGYDALAFRFIGKALALPRIALASFVGFVFSHNIGLSFLGGNAVRYRILTSFGVAPGDIARVVAFNSITFWLGFSALGGARAGRRPDRAARVAAPAVRDEPPDRRAAARGARRVPRRSRRCGARRCASGASSSSLPRPRVDGRAARALDRSTGRSPRRSSTRCCRGAGTLVRDRARRVPARAGGRPRESRAGRPRRLRRRDGVAARPGSARARSCSAPRSRTGSSTTCCRCRRGGALRRLRGAAAPPPARCAAANSSRAGCPRWCRACSRSRSLLAGVVLLASGATPAAPGRVPVLERWIPLPLIEVSHLLGSLIGVALLLLARALQQRLDAAYFLSLAGARGGRRRVDHQGPRLRRGGAALAHLRGAAAVPALLLPAPSLLRESFSADWIVGMALVSSAPAW